MNVLVGCESSGAVRRAFRACGHHAVSCDLLPADDGEQVHHVQGDILDLLAAGDYWDLFIVFPTCTYLCSSGLHWNTRRPGRAEQTEAALVFVQALLAAKIERIAMENPIGRINTAVRKPEQIIQPHFFGHDASKQTCLWLKNLPKLEPTLIVPGQFVSNCGHPRWSHEAGEHCPECGAPKKRTVWANQTDSGQNKLAPSADRWKLRSATYAGVADAMAAQWGSLRI